jgi:nucleotide-binding universal stress UspA family protein
MKRILVGIDGSPRAPGVLAAAIVIARAQGARLQLVRSVGLPAEVPQDFWKTTEDSLLDVLKKHAEQYLHDELANVPSDVSSGFEIGIGSPWQVICDAARALQAELIVIGSHGYSGVDRLLGTTAAKVVNHAPCSVLVVREPQHEASR